MNVSKGKFRLRVTVALISISVKFNKLVNSFHIPTISNSPHNQVIDTLVCLCIRAFSKFKRP